MTDMYINAEEHEPLYAHEIEYTKAQMKRIWVNISICLVFVVCVDSWNEHDIYSVFYMHTVCLFCDKHFTFFTIARGGNRKCAVEEEQNNKKVIFSPPRAGRIDNLAVKLCCVMISVGFARQFAWNITANTKRETRKSVRRKTWANIFVF